MELGRRKADRDKLVITEIPYTMIGAGINKFLSDVAELVESRKLPDVVDISNQSSKEGIRIVLELKKDADVNKIRNILYKKTKLGGYLRRQHAGHRRRPAGDHEPKADLKYVLGIPV